MTSQLFSKISIIESLAKGEKKTGRLIADDLSMVALFNDVDVDVEFFEVKNREEFFFRLDQLKEEATLGNWPLLHIECHGTKDGTGIVLSGGEKLNWAEIKPYLIELNVATRCNLLILLVACFGAHLGQLIQVVDRAPFSVMISPTEEIYPDEVLSTVMTFYKRLFSTKSGDMALDALLTDPLKSGGYYFASIIGFFKKTYTHYLAENGSKKELESRAKRMFSQLKKNGGKAYASKGFLKRRLKSTELDYFQKYYTKFFMVDLYPENATRFPVSYSELKRRARIKGAP